MTCPCRGMNPACKLCGGSPETVCPTCDGAQYVAKEVADGVYHSDYCPDCKDRQTFKPRLIGLTDAMYSWAFYGPMMLEHPPLQRAAEALQEILKAGHGWAVVFGPGSSGKSYLLGASLNVIKTYYIRSGRYARVPDLLEEILDARRGLHPHQLTPNALKTEIINTGLLCLDDLEQVVWTETREQDLRDILVSRASMRGWIPTFVATALRGGELNDRYPWLGALLEDLEHVQRVDLSMVPNLHSVKGRVL